MLVLPACMRRVPGQPALPPCRPHSSCHTQVPLGSVRVSLGYMSTWEDCHALVQFIAAKYSDRNE
jgi:selenocysteine lyase/cysteine desulfurase